MLVVTKDVTNLLNNELFSTGSTSKGRQFQDVEFFVVLLGTDSTVGVKGQGNTGEGWFNQSQVTSSQVTGVDQELSTGVNFSLGYVSSQETVDVVVINDTGTEPGLVVTVTLGFGVCLEERTGSGVTESNYSVSTLEVNKSVSNVGSVTINLPVDKVVLSVVVVPTGEKVGVTGR